MHEYTIYMGSDRSNMGLVCTHVHRCRIPWAVGGGGHSMQILLRHCVLFSSMLRDSFGGRGRGVSYPTQTSIPSGWVLKACLHSVDFLSRSLVRASA